MFLGFVSGVLPACVRVHSGVGEFDQPTILYICCMGNSGTKKSVVYKDFEASMIKLEEKYILGDKK